jgi:hypothetical protein
VSGTMTSPTSARLGDAPSPRGPSIRPDRPCDGCRRRKSRCVISPDAAACVMCQFHKQPCTFVEEAPRRRRQANAATNSETASAAPSVRQRRS